MQEKDRFPNRVAAGFSRMAVRMVFWVATLLSGPLLCQNLIPNPGFESHRRCPATLGNLEDDLWSWSAPTLGSTDYFHACSTDMGTPENFNGEQRPKEGVAYAGLYAFAPDNYREYLQVRLRRRLEEGKVYRFTAYLSLSERSDYALRSLGLLFSNRPLREETRKVLSRRRQLAHEKNRYHFLKLDAPAALSRQQEWGQIQITFEALGTERYLILGNFEPDDRTLRDATGRSSNKGSYYYLDQMDLRSEGAGEAGSAPIFELDSLYTLPTLLFAFDSAVLTEEGRLQLEDLAALLRDRPELILELRGHTDARGSNAYNLELSENRCRTVADFLSQSGVDEHRMACQGYGAKRPVAANSDAVGRLRNRRVEFILRDAGAPNERPEPK